MFGGKEPERREASIIRSPLLHPLAFSSHQRPQGGPNEVKTTSTSFSLTYLHLLLSSYSVSSEQKKKKGKHQPSLHVLLALSDQLLSQLCWRPDESTDTGLRFNPMTQSQSYSVVYFPMHQADPGSQGFLCTVQLDYSSSSLILSPGQEHQQQPSLFDPAPLSCVWMSTLSKEATRQQKGNDWFLPWKHSQCGLWLDKKPTLNNRCTKQMHVGMYTKIKQKIVRVGH